MKSIRTNFISLKKATFFAVSLGMCLSFTPQALEAHPPLPPDNLYSSISLADVSESSTTLRNIRHGLDSFYHREEMRGFNGSVLVGYNGKILYEKYIGYADRSVGRRLGKTTPGQLASTSKPFLGTAILWLYQEGYLDINKPVAHYLKGFPYANITVKMLLDHRSGLPDYVNFAGQYWKGNQYRSNQELVDLFQRVKPKLVFTPGTRFRYCNSNYALLASILESVTHTSYPNFMKKFVFEPLGMTHTFVYDPIHNPKPHPEMTVSYRANWRPWANSFADGIYGDKNIYSTVEDLYKWDQSFYKEKLLKEKTQILAYTPTGTMMKGYRNYGLGWRMMAFPDGYKVIYHNGWWHGNNNVFYRFIKDDLTIIVLGNKYDVKIYDQAKAVYDIIQANSQQANRPSIDWD